MAEPTIGVVPSTVASQATEDVLPDSTENLTEDGQNIAFDPQNLIIDGVKIDHIVFSPENDCYIASSANGDKISIPKENIDDLSSKVVEDEASSNAAMDLINANSIEEGTTMQSDYLNGVNSTDDSAPSNEPLESTASTHQGNSNEMKETSESSSDPLPSNEVSSSYMSNVTTNGAPSLQKTSSALIGQTSSSNRQQKKPDNIKVEIKARNVVWIKAPEDKLTTMIEPVYDDTPDSPAETGVFKIYSGSGKIQFDSVETTKTNAPKTNLSKSATDTKAIVSLGRQNIRLQENENSTPTTNRNGLQNRKRPSISTENYNGQACRFYNLATNKRSVSFEMDLVDVHLINELSSGTKRYRRMTPDPMGHVLDKLFDAKSIFNAKEVRSSSHYRDESYKNMNIHIRIQPEEVKQPFLSKFECPDCDLKCLSIKTLKNHYGNCPKNIGKSPRYNGYSNRAPPKLALRKSSAFFGAAVKKSALPEYDDFSDSESDSAEESSSIESPQFEGFKEDDVVWVRTKLKGLWPALIVEVLPEQRKLSVKLFEFPGQRERIVNVDDTILYDEGMKSYVRKELKATSEMLKAVQIAEKHMRVKVMEPLISEDTAQKESEPVPKVQVDAVKITEYIKNGKADAHMIGVIQGSIESKRQKNLGANEEAPVNDSKTSNPWGPITEEGLQEELYNYCKILMEQHASNKILELDSYVEYILEVLLFEAIVKAMTKIYTIDWNEAEAIFDYHPKEQLTGLTVS